MCMCCSQKRWPSVFFFSYPLGKIIHAFVVAEMTNYILTFDLLESTNQAVGFGVLSEGTSIWKDEVAKIFLWCDCSSLVVNPSKTL